jgi:hypothetical protein
VGRRSRKTRSVTAEPPPPAAAEPRPRGRRARLDEAPRAPWHPVPLDELTILAGLVALAVGALTSNAVLLAAGFALVALASLDVALREHLAGFRSHSGLLGLLVALGVVIPVAVATAMARWLAAVLILVILGAAFVVARAVFRRRSGGFGFRA